MAEIIYPNGETLPFEMKGKTASLRELQDAVGGYIETVPTNDGRIMVVNEEGKLKDLEMNHVATELLTHNADVIVGNAVILGQDEME